MMVPTVDAGWKDFPHPWRHPTVPPVPLGRNGLHPSFDEKHEAYCRGFLPLFRCRGQKSLCCVSLALLGRS